MSHNLHVLLSLGPLPPKKSVKESVKNIPSPCKVADREMKEVSDSDRMEVRVLTQEEEDILKKMDSIIGEQLVSRHLWQFDLGSLPQQLLRSCRL